MSVPLLMLGYIAIGCGTALAFVMLGRLFGEPPEDDDLFVEVLVAAGWPVTAPIVLGLAALYAAGYVAEWWTR